MVWIRERSLLGPSEAISQRVTGGLTYVQALTQGRGAQVEVPRLVTTSIESSHAVGNVIFLI